MGKTTARLGIDGPGFISDEDDIGLCDVEAHVPILDYGAVLRVRLHQTQGPLTLVAYPWLVMIRRLLGSLALVQVGALLAACQTDISEDIAALPAASAPTIAPPEASEGSLPPCTAENFADRDWRELGSTEATTLTDSEGLELSLRSSELPPTSAERYNAAVEICPGILLAIAHDGTSHFIALDEMTWSAGPTLSHSGAIDKIPADGVASGGPTWGIRDAVIVQQALIYADAVIDTDKECVRIDVHRMTLEDILGRGGDSVVIASTEPCVDYTGPQRAASSLRMHMGSALAWDDRSNTLYLSVGDFHLGASTIGQAEGIGLEATLRDYSLLADPASALGSVVGISDPLGDPDVSIVAKGLRNSLGMVVLPDSGLWLSDHGPSGGDELNLITPGSNYGWPLTSVGKPYDRAAWPQASSGLLAPWLDFYNADIEGTTPPVLSWTPAIAPTELAVYPSVGGGIVEYQDLVVLASLRAQSLFVLDISGSTATQLRQVTIGERIRDLTIAASGEIAMLTDSRTLLILSALR